MSWETYENGHVVERGDDETRTVYDGAGVKVRDYTQAENQAADQALADALDMTVPELIDLLVTLVSHLNGTGETDPETNPGDVPDWPSASDYLHADEAILPGALVRYDGLVYRNVSGRPLGHSPALYPPEVWPNVWQRVPTSHDPEPEPEPTTTPAWTAGADYAVGDLVHYEGRLYECIQAHENAPANWYPPAARQQWQDIGPYPA